jgi:hypothetical protein
MGGNEGGGRPHASVDRTAASGVGDPRLRWYARSWRSRYGEELAALLDDEFGERLPVSVRASLISGGIRQRSRSAGLTGDAVSATDGVTAGGLLVLVAWTAFVLAGASLAKFAEHFDQALPHVAAAHRVPDAAFVVLQSTAGLAAALVVTGGLVAAPTVLRTLWRDGWHRVRRPIVRASCWTGGALLATVVVAVLAHRVPAVADDGGCTWRGVLFFAWAALLGATALSWTTVVVTAARSVTVPRRLLAIEGAVAVAVAVAMAVMLGATIVWWGAMERVAPAFLRASPGGAPGTSWDLWLVATVAVMVVAVGAAGAGVVRGIRLWPKAYGN